MKMMRALILGAGLICLTAPLWSDDGGDNRWGPATSGPFYTGTAEAEPLGSDFVEPWVYDQQKPNEHMTSLFMPQRLDLGVGQGWDFSISIPLVENQLPGVNASGVGDTTMWFKREIIEDADTYHFWARPAVSMEALFVLPTGQYQNLNANLNGADQTGSGTFDESIQLLMRKRFKPFSLYAQVGDYIENPTSVETGFGFNNGIQSALHPMTVVNGNLLNYSLCLEQVFNDQWGLGYVLELSGESQSGQSLFYGSANSPSWSYLWGDAGLEMTWPNNDSYAVTWGAGMTWPIEQANYPRTYSPMATVTVNFLGKKGYRGQED